MKTSIIVTLLLFPLFCFAQESGLMKFEQSFIDLGKVKKGEKVVMEFPFKNIGKEDLVIDIVSSCVCTEVDWPVKAIKPGERASINAIFDSTKKDKNEVIDIDIMLLNVDPKNGNPLFDIIQYTYQLID